MGSWVMFRFEGLFLNALLSVTEIVMVLDYDSWSSKYDRLYSLMVSNGYLCIL